MDYFYSVKNFISQYLMMNCEFTTDLTNKYYFWNLLIIFKLNNENRHSHCTELSIVGTCWFYVNCCNIPDWKQRISPVISVFTTSFEVISIKLSLRKCHKDNDKITFNLL